MTALFHVGDRIVERVGAGDAATDYHTTVKAWTVGMVMSERSGSWYDETTGRLIQWGKDGSGKWPVYAAIHHPPKKEKANA